MPKKSVAKRLSFPSLVNGVCFKKTKKAARQFQELLFLEWCTPTPDANGVITYDSYDLYDFLMMARKREDAKNWLRVSEAARLVDEIVRGPTSNANDLLMIDHEQGERYRRLMCSNEFTSLGLVLAGVWSDQTDFQLLAIKKFRRLLLDPCCPAQKPFLLEYDIVLRFEEFLESKDLQLQTEAALALIDLFSFPRMIVEVRVDFDPVKILLKLLDFPSYDVCEKAVSRLASIAGNREGRDRVHRHEVVRPLLDKVLRPLLDDELEKDDDDELEKNHKLLPKLRLATYTLLRFCKGKDTNEVEVTENAWGKFTEVKPAALVSSHLAKVRIAIPELSRLVRLTDEEVLTNACSVLACLTDSTYSKTRVIIGDDVCQQLVKLLEHQSPSVVTPAFDTLKNIASRADIQSQLIVKFGALPCLWKLLSTNFMKWDVWSTIRSLTRWDESWIKENKTEVREKLEQYSEGKLGRLCMHLHVPICLYTARKADMVRELMNFLEGPYPKTEEEPEEEKADNVPERSAEKKSKLDPRDEDIFDAIGAIIKGVDIATAKLTDVMEQLGKKFGTDLTHREMDIRIMISYHVTQPPKVV